MKRLAVDEFREQQQRWDEGLDSLSAATKAKIDSLGIWLEDQAQLIRDGRTQSEQIDASTVEQKAKEAWAKALGALPDDLTAYEKKVAVQELRETLEEQFGLTRDMVKRITEKT